MIKYIILCMLLSFPAGLYAQGKKDVPKSKQYRYSLADSVRKKIGLIRDSLAAARERNQAKIEAVPAEQEIKKIVEVQDRLRERQKRNAILRIVFGLVLLGILVMGLLRKRRREGGQR